MRTRLIAVAVAGVLAAACTDSQSPTAVGLDEPLASLSDGNHTPGNPHFFFLPPIARRDGPFSGVFDHTLDPVVDICELNGTTCAVGGTIAHFTPWSRDRHGESEPVRVAGNHYHVNWHTRRFDLDPAKFYRICVSVGPNALGHADVDVLGHREKRKDVDRSEFVPVQNGSTLPIKFRIEEGALDAGAFVDEACAGALRPAEIRGMKCLVTADEDDEDDDDHPDPSPSLSGRGDRHDDDHDGHDHDGRGEHDDDDDDRDEDHDRDNHRARCEHDDDAGVGWTITLAGTDYQGNAVNLTAPTDAHGKYEFTVQPGTYTVCEVPQSGFDQVFPADGASCPGPTFGYELVLGSGQVAKRRDFGNEESAAPPPGATGEIHGVKIVLDPFGSQLVASNWQINLLDDAGILVATAMTALNGSYAFTNLADRTYTVCEVMESFHAQVSPTAGADCGTYDHLFLGIQPLFGYTVTIVNGQVVTGIDFVNQVFAE